MKQELEKEVTSRYSVIHEKNQREIVLLRGSGCTWRRCRFCDYHLDASSNQVENEALNERELQRITGVYRKLEVINSGSFTELSPHTMQCLEQLCIDKQLEEIHFECHWTNREHIPALRARFTALGVRVVVKIGIETFDAKFRESYLDKGIDTDNPAKIAQYFDECCLLFGIPGQTVLSMQRDLEIGLTHFSRVCVNIMQANGRPIQPDPSVIALFQTHVYAQYADDVRVDILMDDTAFGVGGVTTHAK